MDKLGKYWGTNGDVKPAFVKAPTLDKDYKECTYLDLMLTADELLGLPYEECKAWAQQKIDAVGVYNLKDYEVNVAKRHGLL